MKTTVAQALANCIIAMRNCKGPAAFGSEERKTHWYHEHKRRAEQIARDCLPSGSGFDNGTIIDTEASTPTMLVLATSFHHMNDVGMYDRWTEHTVKVEPAFIGLEIRVTGRDWNGIKDYIAETFDYVLSQPVVYDVARDSYVFECYAKAKEQP